MLKDELLLTLLNSSSSFHSGQDLASQLSVSRTAVWKALNELEKDGFLIDRAQSKGYKVARPQDTLHPKWLAYLFKKSKLDIIPYIYKQIDSTNTEAKRMSQNAELQGKNYLLVAEGQTAGRGRYGRSFFSPQSTGLYLTLSVPIKDPNLDAGLITSATAVAVRRAVLDVYGIDLWIKWVNDLYLNNRKVCGILCEGISNMETGLIDRVFIGIGINLMDPKDGIPDELKEIMGCLAPYQEGKDLKRTNFLVRLMEELIPLVSNAGQENFLDEYRKHCLLLDQEVCYAQNGKTIVGKVITINDHGHLILEKKDGDILELGYGEVTFHDTFTFPNER
ncbi:biotin--[acetyl-CoA-carboxylase] ligase [Atopobacter sp. AH10]|uniref:biotin--[acetyl-CoA-carboxylase] ligase n=1 Tax=Atopobacter sp. AH10 TaxID=2315861 RepID=UPI0013141B0D|nr:biotin--[acetyl-CoA-carboxylase] ligase [Atopobacter sp. AH10]